MTTGDWAILGTVAVTLASVIWVVILAIHVQDGDDEEDSRMAIQRHIQELQDRIALQSPGMDGPVDRSLTSDLVDMINRNNDADQPPRYRLSHGTRHFLLHECVRCELNATTAGDQFESLCYMSNRLSTEIKKG